MELPSKKPEKIKLNEINSYLTCYLCKGYLIDATTISECLHSFCRSCIIKFLQENSYCPVCEVIINKAKPNLKLDKTLQDIVYKLVPELFLKEMTRRRRFYQQYPEIAAKVAPEERGEDTERTIFNPKDFISLSMEYVSDDSAPDAIRIPELKSVLEAGRNGCMEELHESIMKRYLQCPGMCRVEVLKKFVVNKYNVDTNQFHIDILYKRVPLPDHYTLIDIAYIYSWKRNEPMKFFFRITDVNKLKSRFDFFDITKSHPMDVLPKASIRSRNNGDRVTNSARKRDSTAMKKLNKVCKEPSQCVVKVCDKTVENNQSENKVSEPQINQKIESDGEIKNTCDSNNTGKDVVKCVSHNGDSESEINKELLKSEDDKTVKTDKIHVSADPTETTQVNVKPDVVEQKLQSDKPNKSYTNITLNRTNNVEIITKIQPVSNKNGQPIGHHIKQTIKKNSKSEIPAHAGKKIPPKIEKYVPSKDKTVPNTNKTLNNEKADVYNFVDEIASKSDEVKVPVDPSFDDEKSNFLKSIELTAKSKLQEIPKINNFNQSNTVTPKISELLTSTPISVIPKSPPRLKSSNANVQKRKNSSPQKNENKPAKKPKIEKKQVVKIIIHEKPPVKNAINTVKNQKNEPKRDNGLQSLIDSCKINIPSSLSITIKDSTDSSRQPTLIPPVKNYIEILKLPDENSEVDKGKLQIDESVPTERLNPEPIGKFCDNDSEQKVDQDLSEIAKSLTEKIPLSTTVSHIIGPKQQFAIPVQTNAPAKFSIQPSPVPELSKLLNVAKDSSGKSNKLLNVPKDPSGKLTPRSPQTFQKIFEESIKNDQSPPTSIKRNGLEIMAQLSKKTKLEQDKNEQSSQLDEQSLQICYKIASELCKKANTEQDNVALDVKPNDVPVPLPKVSIPLPKVSMSLPKVAIPRLPKQRLILPQAHKTPKFEPDSAKFGQSMANCHSSSLGLNYTVSVAQTSPNKATKVNGIVSPVKADTKIKNEPSVMPPVVELKVPVSDLKILPPGQQSPIKSETPKLISIPRNLSPLGRNNSPKHSPKSSPLIKHMYAPTPTPVSSPLNQFSSLSPKLLTQSPKILKALPKPSVEASLSPKTSPSKSPRNNSKGPLSPKTAAQPAVATQAPNSSPLSTNEILEKYNIQNLAQLTASLNFNAPNFSLNPTNQLAAIQHAMLLNHIEMQNRQNWLNMNQGPLLQYEKYLQSLNGKQNHLLGNIKEN